MSTIEKAQEFFDSGNTVEAIEICLDLLNEKEHQFEATLLITRAVIKRSNIADTEKIADAVINAELFASTIDEYHFATKVLEEEMDNLELTTYTETLAKMAGDPTLDNMVAVFQVRKDAASLDLSIAKKQISPGFQQFLKRVSINSGFNNYDDACAHCKTESFEDRSSRKDEARWRLYYAAGQNAFNTVQNLLNERDELDAELFKSVAHYAFSGLVVTKTLLSTATESNSQSFVLDCKKLMAEIIDYRLKATINVDGEPRSIDQSNRQAGVEELIEFYNTIEAADPNYIRPALPDVEGFGIPEETEEAKPAKSTQTTQNTSSGGCYVATCVYGSYDCPEVWTLRRFRDTTLASTWYGRAFVKFYYKVSPSLVNLFGNQQWFKSLWKNKLDKMVLELQNRGVQNTPYEDIRW